LYCMKISNKVRRRIELACGKLKVERILSEQYVDLMTDRHATVVKITHCQ